VFAGTRNDGIFRRDAASGCWRALGLPHVVVSSIAFVPSDPPRLLVGVYPWTNEHLTTVAVFATTDSGTTWSPSDDVGAAARDWSAAWWLTVDPGDPQRVFGGSDATVRRSLNGGRTWLAVYGERAGGGGIYGIVISPTRDGRVWAGVASGIFSAIVARSMDWGDTWAPARVSCLVNGIAGDDGVAALAVDSVNPSTVFAALQRPCLMRSRDGGATWDYAPRPAAWRYGVRAFAYQGHALYAASFRDENQTAAPPLVRPSLYRTRDGGDTWEQVAVPQGMGTVGGAAALVPGSGGTLLLGTLNTGLWRYQP
jgi:hypothetical protein